MTATQLTESTLASRHRSNKRERTIYINVYSLTNFDGCTDVCGPVGLGLYHSALQVGPYEFAFGGNANSLDSGIYVNSPRQNRAFTFRHTIPVHYELREGEQRRRKVCELTNFELITVLLPQLSQKYRANKYDVLTMNCNHFTNDLL